MATNHVMHRCRDCGKPTLHLQPATSHVLHLLLSVLTFGLWLPLWLIAALSNGSRCTCTVCGRGQGIFGT
jgi:hypothetical protein